MSDYAAPGSPKSSSGLPVMVGALPVAPPAAASTPPATLQARADRILVRALPMLRYRVRNLGVTGVAGAAAIAAAGVVALVLLLPAQKSIDALTVQVSQLAASRPGSTAPALGPHEFTAALPTRAQAPALLRTVLTQAKDAGITLEQGKYTFTPAAGDHLARYAFEFPVKADYTRIRTFIDGALTAVPALGLDKLHLERKNIGDMTVSAEVGFVIYLQGDGA